MENIDLRGFTRLDADEGSMSSEHFNGKIMRTRYLEAVLHLVVGVDKPVSHQHNTAAFPVAKDFPALFFYLHHGTHQIEI